MGDDRVKGGPSRWTVKCNHSERQKHFSFVNYLHYNTLITFTIFTDLAEDIHSNVNDLFLLTKRTKTKHQLNETSWNDWFILCYPKQEKPTRNKMLLPHSYYSQASSKTYWNLFPESKFCHKKLKQNVFNWNLFTEMEWRLEIRIFYQQKIFLRKITQNFRRNN